MYERLYRREHFRLPFYRYALRIGEPTKRDTTALIVIAAISPGRRRIVNTHALRLVFSCHGRKQRSLRRESVDIPMARRRLSSSPNGRRRKTPP
jgi:hypothetical protein